MATIRRLLTLIILFLSNQVTPARPPAFSETTAFLFPKESEAWEQLRTPLTEWQCLISSEILTNQNGYHGVSVVDLNGDGLEDLFVGQPGGLPNRVFLQEPDGTLRDFSERSGLNFLDRTRCALFADFDNDGDQDAVVALRKALVVFINSGEGRFWRRDVLLDRFPGVMGLSAADFDGDGLVDLFVSCHHSDPISIDTSKARLEPIEFSTKALAAQNHLFRNTSTAKTLSFEDVTSASGLTESPARYTNHASWQDMDLDGDPDLAIVNDMEANQLFRNDQGKFTEVTDAGMKESFGQNTSATWGDLDYDGRPDLLITQAFSQAESDFLVKGDGKRLLQKAKIRTPSGSQAYLNLKGTGLRLAPELSKNLHAGSAFAAHIHDLNHDGQPDIFVRNGYLTNHVEKDISLKWWIQTDPGFELISITERKQALLSFSFGLYGGQSWSGNEADHLYTGGSSGEFENLAGAAGLASKHDGRSIAATDWDHDGDLDYWTYSRSGRQLRFLENQTTGSRWLSFRLVGDGKKVNKNAIGSSIVIQTERSGDARLLRQEVQAGSTFLSQSSFELNFGLRENEKISSITVHWRDGSKQSLSPPQLNQHYIFTYGEDSPTPWLRPKPFKPSTEPLEEPKDIRSYPFTTLALYPLPPFEFLDEDGKPAEIPSETPTLLTFWNKNNGWSLMELSKQRAHKYKYRWSDIGILGINLDFDVVELSPEGGMTTLNMVKDTAFLLDQWLSQVQTLKPPKQGSLSMLVDESHKILSVYHGSNAPYQVIEDRIRAKAKLQDRLDKHLPFAGERYDRRHSLKYLSMAEHFAIIGAAKHAADILKAGEKHYRGHPDYIIAKIQAQIDVGRFQEALRLLSVLALEKKRPWVDHLAGVAFFERRDYESALTHFKKADEVKPTIENHYQLGRTYVKTRDLRNAELQLRKAIALAKTKKQVHPEHWQDLYEVLEKRYKRDEQNALKEEAKELGINLLVLPS